MESHHDKDSRGTCVRKKPSCESTKTIEELYETMTKKHVVEYALLMKECEEVRTK